MRRLVMVMVSAAPGEVREQIECEFSVLPGVLDGLEQVLGLGLLAVARLVDQGPRFPAVGDGDESAV